AIPADAARGSGLRRRAILTFELPDTLRGSVRNAASAQRVTLPTMTCAAALLLTSQLSARDDVTIGYMHGLRSEYSIRNRDQSATFERVLGMFNAPMPVRLVVTPTSTGNEVIASVHAALRDGFLHSELPPTDFLVGPGETAPAHQVVYSVMFNYH